jgi:hypothetical protein
MPTRIGVEKIDERKFRVTAAEAGVELAHTVILKAGYYRELTGGKISPEELVRLSFEFLLEREPWDSIMKEFDLPVIGRYFPDYEREMKKRVEAQADGL